VPVGAGQKMKFDSRVLIEPSGNGVCPGSDYRLPAAVKRSGDKW